MYNKLWLRIQIRPKKRGKGNNKCFSFCTFKFYFWEDTITNSELNNLEPPSCWGTEVTQNIVFKKLPQGTEGLTKNEEF